MKIHPMSSWNNSGSLRTLRRAPRNAIVIALDPQDAEKYGLKLGQKELHILYENLPVPNSMRNALQFDPSILPSKPAPVDSFEQVDARELFVLPTQAR